MTSCGGTRSGWRRPEPGAARVRKYLGRRAAYAAGTLLGISVIIFVVLRILPGDPLVAILGVEGHARMSKEDRVRIMADLGLSDPLPVQYGRWLVDIAAGRLGKSFFRGDTVAELIAHRGPISAEIGVLALVISWLVGLPVGILSAFKPNSVPDGVARTLSVLFIAIPGFWLGILIVLALLFWFGYKAPIVIVHVWQDPWQNFQQVLGPAVVLGLAQGAYIARMSRSCLLEVIGEDFVRTARAKGLRESLLVFRRALPNALCPVVTIPGLVAAGGLVGAFIVFVAVAAPLLATRDPLKADFRRMTRPPDAQNFFGTDQVGRDTLSRVIYGARTSLFVAFSAVLLGTTVGSVWGLAGGYLRGRFDLVSQRIMEILQSFPDLILAMAISMAIGTGLPAVIIAIAITRIPFGGRVIRSVALSIREMAYVEAGRASGASSARVMTYHVLPQCIAPYLVLASTHLGVAIVIEAALGFLGVGVPPPTPTWGNMLADAITNLVPSWWLVLYPGLAITITVLAFNLLGDGIRDTLDPRLSPAFLRMMTGGRRA